MLLTTPAMGRLGTETAFDVLARAESLNAKGADIVNLGIGQPDFPSPPHVVEAAIKALRDGHHGYTPAPGLPGLREAVARDLEERHGPAVDPSCIVVVPGGKPTMFFAILMFGEPGAEIICPDPGFPIYQSVIHFSGATPVPVTLREERGFALSAEDVLARVTSRTRLVIVNSPANPTGGVTPRKELERLVKGLAAHPHIAILSDEIYSRIVHDGRKHVSLLQFPDIRDRLILLDGWSKTYAMTGWRLGFGLWPPALVETAIRLCINSHSCVNAAAQFAGIAALEGPQDAVEVMLQAFAERRRVIVDGLNALPGIRCTEPGGAFYAFANIADTGFSAHETQELFLERAQVAAISGTSFGAKGEGFLRFSYANSTENIERALHRMDACLQVAGVTRNSRKEVQT